MCAKIFNIQKNDEKLKQILQSIDSQETSPSYFLEKGILMKTFKNRLNAIVIPKNLVPFVISSYHFMTHVGYEKLLHMIQLKYFWPHMGNDVKDFYKRTISAKHDEDFIVGLSEDFTEAFDFLSLYNIHNECN